MDDKADKQNWRDRNLFAMFRLFGRCHLMMEIPLRLEI